MNRKSFFKTLLGGIGAIVIFPKVIAKDEPKGLVFDKCSQKNIIPPDCLYDGNTQMWHDYTNPNDFMGFDKDGNLLWRDLSGNGNHATGSNNYYAPKQELIIRPFNDSPENGQKIMNYLEQKYNL
jgi:hypothetical protein